MERWIGLDGFKICFLFVGMLGYVGSGRGGGGIYVGGVWVTPEKGRSLQSYLHLHL